MPFSISFKWDTQSKNAAKDSTSSSSNITRAMAASGQQTPSAAPAKHITNAGYYLDQLRKHVPFLKGPNGEDIYVYALKATEGYDSLEVEFKKLGWDFFRQFDALSDNSRMFAWGMGHGFTIVHMDFESENNHRGCFFNEHRQPIVWPRDVMVTLPQKVGNPAYFSSQMDFFSFLVSSSRYVHVPLRAHIIDASFQGRSVRAYQIRLSHPDEEVLDKTLKQLVHLGKDPESANLFRDQLLLAKSQERARWEKSMQYLANFTGIPAKSAANEQPNQEGTLRPATMRPS